MHDYTGAHTNPPGYEWRCPTVLAEKRPLQPDYGIPLIKQCQMHWIQTKYKMGFERDSDNLISSQASNPLDWGTSICLIKEIINPLNTRHR